MNISISTYSKQKQEDHNELEFYRFPRSLQEAFGPHTREHIEPQEWAVEKYNVGLTIAAVLGLLAILWMISK